MNRTANHQGLGIRKFFSVTFVQTSFTIARMAATLALFIGIVFILPAGISQARDVATVQHSNPTSSPATSLKVIIVGDYYPYTFVNDKGMPDGFSVDIAKAVASVMELKLIISVDEWDHALKALADGTIDFLPSMAYSPERDKSFDFSAPHTIAYDAVFFREGEPRINSLKDLAGKTVIVLNNDAAHQYLLSSGMSVKMKLVLVDSLSDALRTLAAGKGDAALMPKLVGLITMKKLNLTNLDPSPIVIDNYNRPFCFAVRNGNQALLERLSQGLSIVKSTGQYQDIYKKWFGALEPPGLSWETAIKYVGAILAVFLLIGSGLLLWTVSLRKQVALQTKDLVAEIKERKQAEEELRLQSEIMSNMAEAVYLVRMEDGIIVYTNSIFESMFGYEQAEMLGKHVSIVNAPTEKSPEETAKEIIDEINEKSFWQGEVNNIKKDSTPFWCYASVSIFEHSKYGRVIVTIHTDITERKQAEEALRESEKRYRELSIVDDLTQLYNSRHFYNQLRMEIDRVDRYGQPLTLLLLDLDDFKAFNDAYGHVEGDLVLSRLGQVVKRCLRQTDSAYRYGGEEFTTLLPMTTSADGAFIAERIRMEFRKETFSPVPGRDVHVTVSIGLGQYKPQEEMKAFVHRVDQLMYQGKKNGKDRVYSEL